MLGKKSIFDSDDVGCDERGRAAHTGKASVDDDVIALREDQAMLITEAIWKTAYKLEQPFATWFDMCAMLDILIRPEAVRRIIVALVEQRVERFE